MSNTEAPELAALLARYQQAWTDGDIEGILSMTPPDGVYEASFGPNPWGQRFVGHDEIRAALLAWVWTSLDARVTSTARRMSSATVPSPCGPAFENGPTGPETIMHGADFYRFSDGMVAAKIAYRKNRQS